MPVLYVGEREKGGTQSTHVLEGRQGPRIAGIY